MHLFTTQSSLEQQAYVEQILEQLNWYILDQARKRIPRDLFLSGELDLEIDELAQCARIKLWQALQKGHVLNPGGYARRVVQTESVDIQRRYKEVYYLSLLENCEAFHDREMPDPYETIEQEETLHMYIECIIEAILDLPPCQQQAMLHTLKKQYDDAFPVIMALKEQGIDIEALYWSDEEGETQKRRASLSISR